MGCGSCVRLAPVASPQWTWAGFRCGGQRPLPKAVPAAPPPSEWLQGGLSPFLEAETQQDPRARSPPPQLALGLRPTCPRPGDSCVSEVPSPGLEGPQLLPQTELMREPGLQMEGVQHSSGGLFIPPSPQDACPAPQFSAGRLGDHRQGLPLPTGEGPYSGHWWDLSPTVSTPGSMRGRAGTGQGPRHTLGGVGRRPHPSPWPESPRAPSPIRLTPQSHHWLVRWEACGGHLGSGVALGPARRQPGPRLAWAWPSARHLLAWH